MAGSKRGPHEKPKRQPRCPLTITPPAWLSPAAKRLYKVIAAGLAAEGYACEIDAGIVAMLANAEQRYRRLQAQEDALESMFVETDKGPRAHPVVAEVSRVENKLKELYAQLLMTPRSRSSSRMTEDQMRKAGAAGTTGSDKERKFFQPRGE